jgi:hypothetical protein
LPKPKKGDLVHLYRRKIGGAGLLLKNIPNVEERYNVDLNEIIGQKRNFTEVPWSLKTKAAIEYLYPNISGIDVNDLVDIVSVLESYSARWDEETKRRVLKPTYHKGFAKVRWLKPPGEYSEEPATYYKNKEAWLPIPWLKVLK